MFTELRLVHGSERIAFSVWRVVSSAKVSDLTGKYTTHRYNSLVVKQVAEAIRHNLKGSVLDIGCGRGNELLELSKSHPDLHVGIDLSIQSLRENDLLDSGIVGDVLHLPIANESIDCVTIIDVAEHLRDPARSFQEIQRCLKKGGKVVILTPNLYRASCFSLIGKLLPFATRKMVLALVGRPLLASPYPVWYRINTINSVKKLVHNTELELKLVYCLPGIPHWFSQSKVLLTLYLAYSKIVIDAFGLLSLAERFCFVLSRR